METNNSQDAGDAGDAGDDLEQLIAEIVADPEVVAEMLKIQPMDVQNN